MKNYWDYFLFSTFSVNITHYFHQRRFNRLQCAYVPIESLYLIIALVAKINYVLVFGLDWMKYVVWS